MPRVNDPFERQHIANLSKYAKIIDEIFKAAAKEAASIGVIVGNGNFDASRVFSFADYPITHKMIQSLLSRLANSVETAIVNGVEAEWTLANNKNNELSRRVFGDNVGKLTQEQYRKYFSSNDEAREAFLARKEQGLNLSERVWRYTECFKSDIELGLDIGIRNGMDAAQMSRQLRQFLQHPDMLFRRVRDEHGNLVLSKRASDFHPGRGVYRSSYKNARRLAVTETNMAYRSADYERMQQLDFVVGIEIRLSNNHTTPGKNGLPIPLVDICDELKGKYPKDFKFTGWHSHCRCFVVTILKTEEELMQENAAILRGEEPSKESVNAVTDVPKEFKDWLESNKSRAERSYSIPYFIKDNKQYLPKGYEKLYGLKMPYESYAEYEQAMKYNKKYANFSEEQKKNHRLLNSELPIIQGKIMDFSQADQGRANPKFSISNADELGYHHNCQTCTLAYELRRRGYCVEAMPNPVMEGYSRRREMSKFCFDKEIKWTDRFLNKDGTVVQYKVSSNTTLSASEFINSSTTEVGRYEVYCAWKKGGSAHVWIVERQQDGNLLWFDPQSGRRGGQFDDYLSNAKSGTIGIMRIDDKLINPKFAERLLKATK